MVRHKKYLLILPAIAIAFAFSNCGQYKVLDSLAQVSSQCAAKLRAPAAFAIAKSMCDDISVYECDRREFRPGHSAPPISQIECVSIGRGEDVCVRVHVYSFDTESARSGAEPSEFLPGGEYNRDEVQCANTRVQNQNITLIQAESESIQTALKSAVDSCYARSSQ